VQEIYEEKQRKIDTQIYNDSLFFSRTTSSFFATSKDFITFKSLQSTKAQDSQESHSWTLQEWQTLKIIPYYYYYFPVIKNPTQL